MKFLLLSFLCLNSFAAFSYPGRPVFLNPRVSGFGNMASVNIYNHTDVDVECRGTVLIHTERSSEPHYYWETIYRKMSSYRTLYLRDFRERIQYTSHSISCSER
jgi:hypothetical protein